MSIHARNRRKKANRATHARIQEAAAERFRGMMATLQAAEETAEALRMRASDAQMFAAKELLSDPRIRSTSVVHGELRFETGWIFAVVQDVVLVIGRFEVHLNENMEDPWAKPIQSGAYTGPPLYSFAFQTGNPWFCLGRGDRKKFFLEMLRNHEYLAAAYILLNSFAHINPQDEERALALYHKAQEL